MHSRNLAHQRPSDAMRKMSAGSAASMPYCKFILLRSRAGSYLSAATAPIAPVPASGRHLHGHALQVTDRLTAPKLSAGQMAHWRAVG